MNERLHNYGQRCTERMDCNCSKHCLCYLCIFKRRARSLHSGSQSRFAAKKWKTGEKAGKIRKEKIPIPYTLEEFEAWLRVTLEDHPFCEYCGVSISITTISPDHRKPISRGGSLERKNLCGACDNCNRIKGELLPGEFKALLAGLKTFTEAGRNDVIKRLKGGILHFGNKKKEITGTNVLAVPAKKNKVFDPDWN